MRDILAPEGNDSGSAGFGRGLTGVVSNDCGIRAASHRQSVGGRWWLVHTKARHEKALAEELDGLGIRCFLPLGRLRRRYGGRSLWVRLPLFPSYLFLHGDEKDRYATLMTHRAATVIEVVDQARLTEELRHIYLLTTTETPMDLYPGIRRGRRCRVVRGSLAGLEGVVLRRRGVCRVYVGVEALGQSAELEIDPAMLEIVG